MNLSFTKINALRSQIVCRLLYAGYEANRQIGSIPEHRHEFWQFEAVVRGPIVLASLAGEMQLESGSGVFIPPGLPHRFHYREAGSEWWSLKFEMEGPRGEAAAVQAPGGQWMREALVLLDLTGQRLRSGGEEQTILAQLEAILGIIAEETFVRHPVVREKTGPCGLIEERLARLNGQRLSVKQLADELGYSPEYLSSAYRQATGKSLKTALDTRLAETVTARLIYTHTPMAELAEEFGFPDVYTFSRFVRRLTGHPPGQIRFPREKSHGE